MSEEFIMLEEYVNGTLSSDHYLKFDKVKLKVCMSRGSFQNDNL